MKKILFVLAGFFIVSAFTFDAKAQVLNGVYVAHNTSERKPIPYQYLREADVMWSKVVQRRINLTEKMNLPLYYPTEEMEGRKSLIQLIMWGIKNKSLTAFQSDNFASQMTLSEIDEKFGAKIDTMWQTDDDTGETVPIPIKTKAKPEEIKELLVKEMWFFDKQRSVMEVRVIGICPIRAYYKEVGGALMDEESFKKMFWVYYPEARNIFANQPVYNQYNQSQENTFDDIFFKRIFSGFIFKESNVYNSRRIEEYTTGLEVLLEAERIKEKIFAFEHDLWEF